MGIIGIPDIWKFRGKREIRILGKNWLNSVSTQLSDSIESTDNRLTLDLSNIDFVSVFEWGSVVSIIEKILSNKETMNFDIDFIGNSKDQLLDPKDYIKCLKRTDLNSNISQADFNLSDRVYQIVGFLESLGTRYFL